MPRMCFQHCGFGLFCWVWPCRSGTRRLNAGLARLYSAGAPPHVVYVIPIHRHPRYYTCGMCAYLLVLMTVCAFPGQAFVAEYEKFPMFRAGEGRHALQDLSEFDDARETVAALSAEYRAAEHRDFVSSFGNLLLRCKNFLA